MINLYETNGLIFWNEKEIKYRNYIKQIFADEIESILRSENRAWHFFEIEAPLLIPRELVNENYTNEDIWVQESPKVSLSEYINQVAESLTLAGNSVPKEQELVLRPETTPTSYTYACHMLNSNQILPPFCIHQTGKSFRREQDQVSKNMRLKEFYQQEFQCIYSADTLNDYQERVLEPIRAMFQKVIGKPARIVESDRLPSYSLRTMDIEIDNGDKWMEIASISKRTDFPQKIKFNTKTGSVEKDMLVLEIAIGLDRCIYNYFL
jgi:glycyl-tRNA synthetase